MLLRLRGAAKTSLSANPWGSSGVHRQPLPRDDGRLLLRPNDDDYFRFTLVRNPLARLLSAFLMRLLLHYTPALAARAAELYAADVSRFGYARDVAAFSARLAAFRSSLCLGSSAAPVGEMLTAEGVLDGRRRESATARRTRVDRVFAQVVHLAQ